MKKLTQTELWRLLCYNPFSGNFMWRVSPKCHAEIKIGDVAGYIAYMGNKRPSRIISIHGHQYRAHRLAFLYMKGHWPLDQVDHKDGDGLNNRWLNIRECNQSQNMCNRRVQKNNHLGVKGVNYCEKTKKYRALITKNGKRIYLGYHDTLEVAAYTHQKAAKKYHREFARTH